MDFRKVVGSISAKSLNMPSSKSSHSLENNSQVPHEKQQISKGENHPQKNLNRNPHIEILDNSNFNLSPAYSPNDPIKETSKKTFEDHYFPSAHGNKKLIFSETNKFNNIRSTNTRDVTNHQLNKEIQVIKDNTKVNTGNITLQNGEMNWGPNPSKTKRSMSSTSETFSRRAASKSPSDTKRSNTISAHKPMSSHSPTNAEAAAAVVAQEMNAVKTLKRLSIGALPTMDPDLPNYSAEIYRSSKESSISSASSTSTTSSSPNTSIQQNSFSYKFAPSESPPINTFDFSNKTPNIQSKYFSPSSASSSPSSSSSTQSHDLASEKTLISSAEGSATDQSYSGNTSDINPSHASQLLWVPAHVHPELAPQEWKTFVQNKVAEIKASVSVPSSGTSERSLSSGKSQNIHRRNSRLSRQIEDQDGYTDGADILEKRKSRDALSDQHTDPTIKSLSNQLKSLGELESLAMDPFQLARSLSLNSNLYYYSTSSESSNTTNKSYSFSHRPTETSKIVPLENDSDSPILPAPTSSLRRSTRTRYNKSSIRRGRRDIVPSRSLSGPIEHTARSSHSNTPEEPFYLSSNQLDEKPTHHLVISEPSVSVLNTDLASSEPISDNIESYKIKIPITNKPLNECPSEGDEILAASSKTKFFLGNDYDSVPKILASPQHSAMRQHQLNGSTKVVLESVENKQQPEFESHYNTQNKAVIGEGISVEKKNQAFIETKFRPNGFDQASFSPLELEPSRNKISKTSNNASEKTSTDENTPIQGLEVVKTDLYLSSSGNIVSKSSVAESSLDLYDPSMANMTSNTVSFLKTTSEPNVSPNLPYSQHSINQEVTFDNDSHSIQQTKTATSAITPSQTSENNENISGSSSAVSTLGGTEDNTLTADEEEGQSKSKSRKGTWGWLFSGTTINNSQNPPALSSQDSIKGISPKFTQVSDSESKLEGNLNQVPIESTKSRISKPSNKPSIPFNSPPSTTVNDTSEPPQSTNPIPGSGNNKLSLSNLSSSQSSKERLSNFFSKKKSSSSLKQPTQQKLKNNETIIDVAEPVESFEVLDSNDRKETTQYLSVESTASPRNSRSPSPGSGNRKSRSKSPNPRSGKGDKKSKNFSKQRGRYRSKSRTKSPEENQISTGGDLISSGQNIAAKPMPETSIVAYSPEAAAYYGAPYQIPPHQMSDKSLVMMHHRYPLHIERAIYRLSHLKLANPRRPLVQQVLLSNFMYAYLNLINQGYIQQQQQAQLQLQLQQQQQQQQNQHSVYDDEFEHQYDEYSNNGGNLYSDSITNHPTSSHSSSTISPPLLGDNEGTWSVDRDLSCNNSQEEEDTFYDTREHVSQ